MTSVSIPDRKIHKVQTHIDLFSSFSKMAAENYEIALLNSIWIEEEKNKELQRDRSRKSKPFIISKQNGNRMHAANISLWKELTRTKGTSFEKNGKHKSLFNELIWSWNSKMEMNQLSIAEKVSEPECDRHHHYIPLILRYCCDTGRSHKFVRSSRFAVPTCRRKQKCGEITKLYRSIQLHNVTGSFEISTRVYKRRQD